MAELEAPTMCSHVINVKMVETTCSTCRDCLLIGEAWLQLRMCTECGHVGCCDSSKNKHAAKHFRATPHPVVRSIQPGEEWAWC